jgi:Tol biopolymer transport system component
MSRRLVLLVTAVVALFAGAFGATTAHAERGPIELVSKSATEQADFAEMPALSADGRYVAFRAEIGGLEGIFRKDLDTGALVPVAAGNAYAGDPVNGAVNPSISADGRFISFTTTAPLDPEDDGAGSNDSDVYVADMSSSPPTYELAPARDGCDPALSSEPCGLSYADPDGSVAAGRVALSADGTEVAFVVETESDLTNPLGQVETPSKQVAVRNLISDRTSLISVERDPTTGAMTEDPVRGGAAVGEFGTGAALSADGSTVAWFGTNLPAQVPMLADEREAIENAPADQLRYAEPLWRRVPSATEPTPATRRIIGGGDPLAPGCTEGGTLVEEACDGPYPGLLNEGQLSCNALQGWFTTGSSKEALPQLSEDGRSVGLIGEPEGFSDVFEVDMGEGLTRLEALRKLTTEVPIDEPCNQRHPEVLAGTGPIESVAISPDGTRIAFTTARQEFPGSPFHLVSPRPAKVGLPELYVLDLEGETIERLTPTNLGEASTGKVSSTSTGATSVSFSADGKTIAFASAGSNVVPGDGNESSDAFVVRDVTPPSKPGTSSISPPPAQPGPKARWRLTASALSYPGGRVKIRALVPGAGKLRVKARATVGKDLAGRLVAAAQRRPRRGGLFRMVMRLKPGYRRLAHGAGLGAALSLSFNGPGGKPLHFKLAARFVDAPKKRKSHRSVGGTR